MAQKFWRLGKARALNTLTLHDISFWGAFDMVTVVFALLVVNNIPGGTPGVVGIALFLYKFVSTLLSIPVGRLVDRLSGLEDENWGLIISSVLISLAFFFLAVSTAVIHVYLSMMMMGLARVINLNSWRKLFNKFLEKQQVGTKFGIYETIFSLGTSLLGMLAGILSDHLSFRIVVAIAGLIALSGTLLPMSIWRLVRSDES